MYIIAHLIFLLAQCGQLPLPHWGLASPLTFLHLLSSELGLVISLQLGDQPAC